MTAMSARVFCAWESRASGEPLAGTGIHPERNLLLSWPIGQWSRNLRQAQAMAPAVAEYIESLAAAGRRVNLIDRKGHPATRHRVYLMPENQAYDVPRAELPAFLEAVLDGADPAHWRAGPVEGALVLCCTHGKKDKCCAKFGAASYQALARAARQRPEPFEVWQCTHLGGCRLAASAMVFPQRHKYGRIAPEQADALLAAEAAGQPYLPCYRGASHLTAQQQCAEVAARGWLAEQGLHTNGVTVSPAEAPATVTRHLAVRWHTPHAAGELAVDCSEEAVSRYATCADIDAGDPPAAQTVWRARAIQPR